MATRYFTVRSLITLLPVALVLCGCGGTKVLKEPHPIQTTQPLAVVSDQGITAMLDWVIVRDGPGTWAKNADWDEYLVRISNSSDQPIQLISMTVIDSLNTRVEPQPGRKQLVNASKQTAARYKESEIKVKAGRGTGAMLATGAAVTVVGAGVGGAVAYASLLGTATGGAATAAGGLLLLGPAIVVGGVVRGVNNSAVNTQIEQRQTALPLDVAANAESGLHVFFPLAPSPGMVELIYADASGEHKLIIDTGAALQGLHLNSPTK